jgi:adenosine deaminase
MNQYFKSIQSNQTALYNFLKEMPKGGELHYHLAGGAYPETMLDLAAQDNYCIQFKTNSINKSKPCHGTNTKTLPKNPLLYQQIIRAWSMKSFQPKKESGHDHFFASFLKFMPIINDKQPQLLAAIMKRAAEQHELYLEIQILPDNALSSTFGQHIRDTSNFSEKRHILLKNKRFQNNILHTINESHSILKQARHELGCDLLIKQPACSLTIKFQYYILREQGLDNLFSQALNGFAAAEKSEDIVGVNLVQAEDGDISMRDYQQQMKIFKFLHSAYPSVNISLHAGELESNTQKSFKESSHIHDAILIGQAQRIGHGVAIYNEANPEKLLNYMAKTHTPVEINLTSNQKILNVSGKEHPFAQYLSHHVPIVLSTDDEGILRTSLTKEYVKAVTLYNLDYSTIKTINRNTLTYSFLPGQSLWKDANRAIPVKVCKDFDTPLCQQFLKQNTKARLQWQLEQKLIAFESNKISHSTSIRHSVTPCLE